MRKTNQKQTMKIITIAIIIIAIAIININTAKAINYTDTHTQIPFASQGSVTFKIGSIVKANSNVEIITIVKDSSSTSTTVWIYDKTSGLLIGNTTYIGNNATFSIPINITAGKTYYLVNYKGGVARNYYGKSGIAGNLPENTGIFNWTGRVYNNSGSWSESNAEIDEILSIKSQDITTTSNNFSITITNVNTYNATINGTYYNTTNGTIQTEIENNETIIINITIRAINYTTKQYINRNLSTDITTILIPLYPTKPNITRPNLTETIREELNVTFTNSTRGNTDQQITYYINLTNKYNTYEINTTNITKIINTINEGITIGYYNLTIKAKDQYNQTNTSEKIQIRIKPKSDYVTINIYNYLGTTLISNANLWNNYTNTTTNGNPIQINIYNFINETNPEVNITINITDLTYYHQDYSGTINISANKTQHNITLEPNKLVLTFYENDILTNVSGYIADSEKQLEFENTSLIAVQQNLTEGYIHIRLNMLPSKENWTQYYEYINDYTNNHITEDIHIISNADWSAYIRVLDYSNSPLKDVTIRAEYTYNELNNWTYKKLMGQRLTDELGYTFFFADKKTEIRLSIAKDGYEAVESIITIGDESFTKNEPLTFYLKASQGGVKENAWLYIQRYFTNRSIDLMGVITAKDRDRVQVQTDYRETQGLLPKDITSTVDEHERYTFYLYNSIDYEFGSTDDITLSIYLDNELWRTITIEYDPDDEDEGVLQTDTISPIIVLIGIIILGVAIGLITHKMIMGANTFFALMLITPIINTR